MNKRRSNCPVSCWLDIFGDKWTLLIVRDIAKFKKKNFKDFMDSTEGISTNILADRLKLLVENGIITKSQDENNKLIINYEITEKGLDLQPVFIEISQWSNTYIDNTLKVF